MAKEKFDGVSDAELLTEENKLIKLNKIYGILMLVLFLAALYLGIFKSNYTFIAIVLALFSIYIVNVQSLKDFKKEIEKRNLSRKI